METVNISISMNYTLWMLENRDELSELEQEWVSEFKRQFNEEIEKQNETN